MSLLGGVQSSRLGVCPRVQLGMSLSECPEVYLRQYSEVYLDVHLECSRKYLESVSQVSWECTIQCNQE